MFKNKKILFFLAFAIFLVAVVFLYLFFQDNTSVLRVPETGKSTTVKEYKNEIVLPDVKDTNLATSTMPKKEYSFLESIEANTKIENGIEVIDWSIYDNKLKGIIFNIPRQEDVIVESEKTFTGKDSRYIDYYSLCLGKWDSQCFSMKVLEKQSSKSLNEAILKSWDIDLSGIISEKVKINDIEFDKFEVENGNSVLYATSNELNYFVIMHFIPNYDGIKSDYSTEVYERNDKILNIFEEMINSVKLIER